MAKVGRPKLEKNMSEAEKFEHFWDSMDNDRKCSIIAVLSSGNTIIGKARQFEPPTIDEMAELDMAITMLAESFGLRS